jgi:hypothetical protein
VGLAPSRPTNSATCAPIDNPSPRSKPRRPRLPRTARACAEICAGDKRDVGCGGDRASVGWCPRRGRGRLAAAPMYIAGRPRAAWARHIEPGRSMNTDAAWDHGGQHNPC